MTAIRLSNVLELPTIRERAYRVMPCIPSAHVWTQIVQPDSITHSGGPLVLLVLCETCGITPLEMLGGLKIMPNGYDPRAVIPGDKA